MDEPWVRLVVVVAASALAMGWAVVARRGVALRRRRVELSLEPGSFLFTSPTCASCDQARQVLDGMGVEYREIGYETRPELFAERIRRVPTFVHLDTDGSGWMAEGVPSPRRLERWLEAPPG